MYDKQSSLQLDAYSRRHSMMLPSNAASAQDTLHFTAGSMAGHTVVADE